MLVGQSKHGHPVLRRQSVKLVLLFQLLDSFIHMITEVHIRQIRKLTFLDLQNRYNNNNYIGQDLSRYILRDLLQEISFHSCGVAKEMRIQKGRQTLRHGLLSTGGTSFFIRALQLPY